MFVDPFAILLALLPIVGYLAVIGVIRVSGRVLVTTGGRDLLALGFAIAGLIAVGPAELFFPSAAAGLFGPWVWVALFTFYSLIMLLLAMTMRPRLVVYGRSPDQLGDALLRAAMKLDETAKLDSETRQVHLSKLGVRLRVAGHPGFDFASIESFEPVISPIFWNQLLAHFRESARNTPASRPRGGLLMLMMAGLLLGTSLYVSFAHGPQVVDGFQRWLFR